MNSIVQIILALFGGGAIFSFFQFLISRYDKKHDINEKLDAIQKSTTRNELMLLMKNYSERKEDIMKVAYKYFVKIKGDFYLTTLYDDYLRENNIEKPDWFRT